MKLWEKLDKAIKEQENIEKKLTIRINTDKGDDKIYIWIDDDPMLNIGGKRKSMFDNKPILNSDFVCDVKYAEKIAHKILELINKEG